LVIGPYILKGKDGLQIDFMALTMIDPASSWFEIVELPVVDRQRTMNVNGRELLTNDEIQQELGTHSASSKQNLVV